MRIDVAVLVIGGGPAALVAAKIAGACGQPCLLAGHHLVVDDDPVALGRDASAVLEQHALLDVLRPHLHTLDPLAISPHAFETVLKQHCVADLNVTVYDDVALVDCVSRGRGLRAVLTSGATRWQLVADVVIDGSGLPTSLPEAIIAGAAATRDAIAAVHALAGAELPAVEPEV